MFIFSGCINSKTPKIPTETTIYKPSEKAFEQEDLYILFALRSEQIKDYNRASELYDTLYYKSKKKEYLYRSIKNLLLQSKSLDVIERVDKYTKMPKYDSILLKMKIIALIQLSRLDEAEKLALILAEETKIIDNNILVADIYVKQKKFDKAVNYLKGIYLKDYNEIILDKLSVILYVNLKEKSKAIRILETHAKTHGYSLKISSRLIAFYSNEKDIDGLLSTYLRVYELNKNKDIAVKIVQIYQYQKEYIKSMNFLEKTSIDDRQLLTIYIDMKNYEKASILANKLYKESGDIEYLAKSAICDYESLEDKNNKKSLEKIVEKFEKVMIKNDKPLYLNYFGFLLIEHEIDVVKGIAFIKKALLADPDSYYYLDSLAWGYYKLGECKKAKKYMDKVIELEGGFNKEVIEHIDAINRCITKQKKVKR